MASSVIKNTSNKPELHGWYWGLVVPSYGLCVTIPCDTTRYSATVTRALVFVNSWITLTDTWQTAEYGTAIMFYYQGSELSQMTNPTQLVSINIEVTPK